MLQLRRARLEDVDFLAVVDMEGEGYTPSSSNEQPRALDSYRETMRSYVTDPDKATFVAEDTDTGKRVGMVAGRFRQWPQDQPVTHGIFDDLDPALFPADGRFCEIFQLWVDPAVRRRGLAFRLKQELEAESQRRGIHMIYTHTEATNLGVIALNKKLGYREVSRGPIWDSVIRVRLIKYL
jgi:ribosomal protein S18 acetylase RimI-like enzyme